MVLGEKSGRPRSPHADQAILTAALALLAEHGYGGVSIEMVAAQAGVSKATIYRRYPSKEALIADALEQVRQEISIPDTGNLWQDLDLIIAEAAQMSLHPLGRQIVALIVSTATTQPHFAELYWRKYLQPRRTSFAIVLERAKARAEIAPEVDGGIIFDLLSGIMLYGLMFQPTTEPWESYVRRVLAVALNTSPRQ